MPRITYITSDGSEHVVEAEEGQNAMQVAVNNAVPGIDGDCGGAVACGTCHVRVGQGWLEKTGTAKANEREMLAFAEEVTESSRLSCQIVLNAELDGLVLHVPQAQF